MNRRRLDRIEIASRYLLLLLGAALALLLLLTVIFFATRPSTQPLSGGGKPSTVTNADGSDNTNGEPGDSVTLATTPDACLTYQDKLIFVGDSLTAHMANRGVLTGGTATYQVWRTENNLLNLNAQVTEAKIVLPGTGEKLTIAEAAKRTKPSILVITLGTDWGVAYLNEEEFKACYSALVEKIQAASPNTKIILQSIFPVTKDCVVPDNAKIDAANRWVKSVAAAYRCRYLDTQSILKDETGALKPEYCNSSDGIHLTTEAYVRILSYTRTHAWN